VEEVTASLTDAGFRLEVVTDLERLGPLVEQRQAEGDLRLAIGGGGDGTVSEVVNRIPVGTPVTILPLGTENLLARYLGLRADAAAIRQVVETGAVHRFDAGLASGRLFTLMIGCGFDAEVVRRLHDARTGHIRRWTYAKPILAAIRRYSYPEIRVRAEVVGGPPGQGEWLTARWWFVFNLPCYGGGLKIAPWADGADGTLDLCGFARGSLPLGLWYLSNVVLGRHRRLADCLTGRVRRLKIEADEPVPYQLDGDPAGWLPLDVDVLPGRLALVTPTGTQRAG
jgi:diacylglycerol kinase family enzyme